VASAHIHLLAPVPRYPDAVAGENKNCPCGVGTAGRTCSDPAERSDPNRSSVVGSELVLREKCDLVLCFDSDAALAVGELADARSMPTISTNVPWTGWKFSRGATPDDLIEKSFPYTFHFFWGAGEVVKNFLAMWNSVKTNKQVGTFYSDTPTGRAFGNAKTGLPSGMTWLPKPLATTSVVSGCRA